MDIDNKTFIENIRNNEEVEVYSALFNNPLLEASTVLYAVTLLRNKYKYNDDIYCYILKDVLKYNALSDDSLIEIIRISNNIEVIELVISMYGNKEQYINVITKVVSRRIFYLGTSEAVKIVESSFITESLLEIILFKSLDLYTKNYSEYKIILDSIYKCEVLTSRLLIKIVEFFGKHEVINVLMITNDTDVMLFSLRYIKSTYGIYDKIYKDVTDLLLTKDYLEAEVLHEIAFIDPSFSINEEIPSKNKVNHASGKILPFARKKIKEEKND